MASAHIGLSREEFVAQKEAAIKVVYRLWQDRARRLVVWWQWTAALHTAIAIQRIESLEPSWIDDGDHGSEGGEG